MKRWVLLGAVLALLVVEGLAFAASGETWKFAIVYPIVHPFFNETTRGAQDAAKEFGVEVEILGPDTADIGKQVAIVEGLIAKKIDGIGLGVLDPTALTPYINTAMEKGIPVVTFDTDAPQSNRLCFIGTNNVEAGKHAARVAIDILQKKYGSPKGKICISMGVPTQLNLNQRLEGFKEVIAQYPEVQIVDIQTGYGDPEKTTANIENMVTAHPDMDLLFGVDAQAGPSAVVVWKARGLKIPVVTFDDLPDIIAGVRQGIITTTIVQRQYNWGYLIVESLVKAKKGKPLPVNMDTGTIAVTAENVNVYYPEK
ncbi:MAG: sugar-binding protein [Candidatus Caldatribacterium sp.]|nr:sugar-binding protein [Candidatus Caldatribacterium sp.]